MKCPRYVMSRLVLFTSSNEVEFISQSIGQTGKVLSVDSDGDVKIEVSGSSWAFNPLCVAPVNKNSMYKVCVSMPHHCGAIFTFFLPSLTLVIWFVYWMMLMLCVTCKMVMESGLTPCQQ